MRTIFALASGRSGTHFLYEIIHRNVINCVCHHETYGYNPSMFGRPIYDHHVGERRRIRKLLERKRRIVRRCGARTYVETSHAFLKSWYDLAPEYFPSAKLVHLLRNPLSVAKSLANREALARRYHLPFCHYRGGDGQRYFRWAVTRREPIFTHFDLARLSLFQWCVLEWIEIENRAAWFLDTFQKREDCVAIRVPHEINDNATMLKVLERLELTPRTSSLDLRGRTNRTPGIPTDISAEDQRQFDEVIRALPDSYLSIFRREPYGDCEWSRLFRCHS